MDGTEQPSIHDLLGAAQEERAAAAHADQAASAKAAISRDQAVQQWQKVADQAAAFGTGELSANGMHLLGTAGRWAAAGAASAVILLICLRPDA